MKMSKRDRRDWSLLVFILPLGILLMLIAGQLALRIIPQWILVAEMGSNLQLEVASGQQNILNPLFNIQILTPFAWQNTYLTPKTPGSYNFPGFIVLEPSATPSPTATPAPNENTPVPTATTITPSPTSTVIATTPPPTSTQVTQPPATCQDPSAENYGGSLPCTYPPTTCEDPAATNYGGSLPCVYPPTTCEDPAATNYGGSLPCVYPPTPPATVPPGYTENTPPGQIEVGSPPNGSIGSIVDGTYIIINLSLVVSSTPDNNYDLVFYEYNNGGSVYLDWIVIGITNDADDTDGISYYEVFNWGNVTPDTNSNVGDVAQTTGTEDDNQQVNLTELHDADGGGSAPQTGILIDVDNATSAPPPATYNYVVVISPSGGSGESAQIDSIQATEVSIPPPPP